ncbi:MAG: hypothetical protein M1834_001877 [Cirrosporium novae-zelandiae]|nr:MAG: hypothetical protein M1834_001877 [Cirrosporium novae-zelandiae]
MAFMNPPSDAETLSMWEHTDETSREVDEYIKNHPLAKSLRANPNYVESIPHMKIPESYRNKSLTGGTLIGNTKFPVPPRSFSERGGKSLIQIQYLGSDLCGHPGIVHGGLLATMLDEGLARCCFDALPNKVAMTANLNINYRRPAVSGGYYVLRARTTKIEGRKAWVEGHIENLTQNGEERVIYADAVGLFIEPRNTGMLGMSKKAADKSGTQPATAG